MCISTLICNSIYNANQGAYTNIHTFKKKKKGSCEFFENLFLRFVTTLNFSINFKVLKNNCYLEKNILIINFNIYIIYVYHKSKTRITLTKK